jgi:hypothetical protein
MTTICRTYATEAEAHAAVRRAVAAGAAEADVRVLMGERAHDARDGSAGSFADAEPEAVGAFAGGAHSSREAMGAFAGDGHDARRGAFADVDRETVTTLAGGVERVRVASHHALKRMLVDAGLDEAAADADVQALHDGRVLVLVSGATATEAVVAALGA